MSSKTVGSTSVRYRSDTNVSDRYLIDADPRLCWICNPKYHLHHKYLPFLPMRGMWCHKGVSCWPLIYIPHMSSVPCTAGRTSLLMAPGITRGTISTVQAWQTRGHSHIVGIRNRFAWFDNLKHCECLYHGLILNLCKNVMANCNRWTQCIANK